MQRKKSTDPIYSFSSTAARMVLRVCGSSPFVRSTSVSAAGPGLRELFHPDQKKYYKLQISLRRGDSLDIPKFGHALVRQTGKTWIRRFFEAYGVAKPDQDRIRFYNLLDRFFAHYYPRDA